MPELSLAIIDSNMLVGIGLQQIIKDIMPADIQVFSTFEELKSVTDGGKNFIHFFVASRVYFEHTQFFRDNARKSVVLVNGDMQIAGMKTLNVCQSEKTLVKSILSLHGSGHGPGHPGPSTMKNMHAMAGHPGAMGEHSMGSCPHSVGDGSHSMNEERPKEVEPSQQLLSSREVEVAVLLSKGFINKEIADKLNISITTVITHRTHIMEKLKARSLADVIIYSVLNGLVEVGEL